MNTKLEKIARKYFFAWNEHDINSLEELFSPDITLQDWDILKKGINEVLEANKSIFDSLPNINAEILNLVHAENIVFAELLIQINDKETLKVVDILQFENDLITSISAFKQ